MTDRVTSLIVVLSKDIRIDDCEALINAIKQLRGVIDVTPNISDHNSHMAEVRAREVFLEKALKFVKEVRDEV